jgi:hypothetical protein
MPGTKPDIGKQSTNGKLSNPSAGGPAGARVTLLIPSVRTILPICRYLHVREIETDTWDVLPDSFKTGDIVDYVVRELKWVRDSLQAASP